MRSVLEAVNFDTTHDPALDAVKHIKWPTPPENFLPWLLQELSLSSFIPYQTDLALLYEQGRELNHVKGTKRAIRIVAEWFGFMDIEIRTEARTGVHFPEFQLGLDSIPDDPHTLCDLLDAINRVKPLRSRFRRVWHGLDIGIFYLSESPWGQLLSDYSGIHSTDINLCLSPSLCTHDLRISFQRQDADWVQNGSECGDSDDVIVYDDDILHDELPLPVLSEDFVGPGFYPLGHGSIGEHEFTEDNDALIHDGNANREWMNLNWVNDDWPQGQFGFFGEDDGDPPVFNYILDDDGDYAADEDDNPIVYA